MKLILCFFSMTPVRCIIMSNELKLEFRSGTYKYHRLRAVILGMLDHLLVLYQVCSNFDPAAKQAYEGNT